MSLYDFDKAIQLTHIDTPFYSLIMAAVLRADTQNLEKLTEAFPDIVEETKKRYHAPGGVLEDEV